MVLWMGYIREVNKLPDFVAELNYLSTEAGGRKTPARNGYRPHIKFPFSDYMTSGQQNFIDKEWVYPGEIVMAEINILAKDVFANKLEVGMGFEFCEGAKVIGTGKIIEIINPVLRKVY